MRRFALLLLLLFPTSARSGPVESAIEADSLRWPDRPITRIQLRGLRHTRPSTVLRELSCREGDLLNWNQLGRDRLRLLDLDLFADLDFTAVRDSAVVGPVLRIEARERPTFYILPDLEYAEVEGFTYGLFGAELNLDGRAWRGSFSGGWGGRRFVHVSAGAPWIAGRRLATGLAFDRSRNRNRAEAQREDRVGTSLALAPMRGPHLRFPFDFGWERVQATADPPDSLRHAREDDHRWVGLGVRRDTRESAARAIRGSVVGLQAVGHGGILGGTTSLQRYECDLLRLFPTGPGSALTVATRAIWSRGSVPAFLRVGLGGASTLRGSEAGVYRGESRWYGWMEERFPLVPRQEIAVARGRYTLDVTVDGAVFLDVGSAWSGDDLQRGDARARWGAGLGLRFLLPLVSLLQCDAATDGHRVRFHTFSGLRL